MSRIHGPKRYHWPVMSKAWLSGFCSIIIGINMGTSLDVLSMNISDEKVLKNHNVDGYETAALFMSKFRACGRDPVCPKVGLISSATSELRNVWYVANGKTIIKVRFGTDEGSCNCTKVFAGSESISSLMMDDSRLFWLQDSAYVKYLSTPIHFSSSPHTKRLTQEMVLEEEDFRRAGCYLPQRTPPSANIIRVTQHSAELNISNVIIWKENWLRSPRCDNILNPNVEFGFYFYNLRSENFAELSALQSTTDLKHQPINSRSSLCKVMLKGLQSNSVYKIFVTVTMESGNQKYLIISDGTELTTFCEAVLPPKDPKCFGINSTALTLSWDRSEDFNQVRYEVLFRQDTSQKRALLLNNQNHSSYMHNGLVYANYTYTIRAHLLNCKSEPKPYNEVTVTNCKPFHNPVSLIAIDSTNQSLRLLWESPDDNSVKHLFIEWMEITNPRSIEWRSSKLIKVKGSFTYTITDLKSNTGYQIRTSQQYIGHQGTSGWTTSTPIFRKTKPGVPDFPRNSTVQQNISTSILSWSNPNANGAALLGYVIWYRNESSQAAYVSYGSWHKLVILSETKTTWDIQNLSSDMWYEFQVSAINWVGEGDRSASSNQIFYQSTNISGDSSELIGVIAGVAVFVVSLVFAIFMWRCRAHRADLSDTNTPLPSATVVEDTKQLQHLPESTIPQNCETSISSNLEIPVNLPLLPSEKLELLEFLGKGAFGEVYEGIAYDIGEERGTSTRVAVKILKEGSDEKKEFLMEARIMSNFHHKNILSLLGVCWDATHQFLVMELMEGGDLSHYLREAKPTSITLAKLSTVDLIDICLDIAAGCRYLEERHFIHRDLAARNCLISTKDYSATNKVVKIGDFGLARDIYRSEYYHKHGEGLLPVRWMAPESLEENLYTTQSDVWSFGILIWEVMSYGKRPYQILNDIEILQFIKAGGRLEKPDDCPEPIYILMTKCWLSAPIFRPSFAWTLEFLHNIKDACDGLGDSDSDILPRNYVTASSSDEDFADEGIKASRTPTPDLRGQLNITFDVDDESIRASQTPSPDWRGQLNRTFDLDEDEIRTSQSPLPDLARQLFKTYQQDNEETESFHSLQLSESLEIIEATYTKDIFTNQTDHDDKPLHEHTQASSSCLPLPTSSMLLPYIGDLPITDEERLLRKKQWNQQVSHHTQQ